MQDDEKTKRVRSVKVRLTEQEHSDLMNRKQGQLSAWIRQTCLDQQPRKFKKADPELIRHLGKIGANLNQLARYANAAPNDNINTNRIFSEIEKIRLIMEQVLKNHDC